MEHTAISALRATAIDGRAHNVFYRLEQLEKLHRSLVRESLALLEAIATDSGNTASDARIEFVLTAHTVKEQYARLDPKIELRNEYAIANGENADTLRVPCNIVIIKPTAHTLLYSMVAPLSAALAAGCCVAIQV